MAKSYLLPVEVQKLESGRYLAICEVIQGCHAEGDTVAEALENLEDVARILLELRKEDGLALPEGLRKQRIAKGECRGAEPPGFAVSASPVRAFRPRAAGGGPGGCPPRF